MASKITTLKKPSLTPDAVRAFAEKSSGSTKQAQDKERGITKLGKSAASPKSGLVPDGDVRLTANIRADLHLKLKIEAAKQRTTVGELIEQLIDNML